MASSAIAFLHVFLEPTPIACSAAMGSVNRLVLMLVGVCLLELCRLSLFLGSKVIWVRAKMRVTWE